MLYELGFHKYAAKAATTPPVEPVAATARPKAKRNPFNRKAKWGDIGTMIKKNPGKAALAGGGIMGAGMMVGNIMGGN